MSHNFPIGVQPPCGGPVQSPRGGRSGGGGFTLIELLVVIAIVAILIAFLVPSLAKAKEMARRSVCATQQRAIAQASFQFAFDHRSYLPHANAHAGIWWADPEYADSSGKRYPIPGAEDLPIKLLWNSSQKYLADKKLMQCPSRTDHFPEGHPRIDRPVIKGKEYNNFMSNYHFTGGSADWPGPRRTTGFVYRVSLTLQSPDQPLLSDMLVPNDEEVATRDWPWLKQTNHWVRGQGPQGTNITYLDGSSRWMPYPILTRTQYATGGAGGGWTHYGNSGWADLYGSTMPKGTYFAWLSHVLWYNTEGNILYFFKDTTTFRPSRGTIVGNPAEMEYMDQGPK